LYALNTSIFPSARSSPRARIAAITFGYNYYLDVDWPPGVYELKAYWPGNCKVSDVFGAPVEPPQIAKPSESDVAVLTVKGTEVPMESIISIWGVAATAIVVVSGVFIVLKRRYTVKT
jgi:hypothetical protein